jgi:hypothetical protein
MSQYTCKDCRHSFRTVSLVLAHGFNSPYSRQCRLSYREAHSVEDPVIGVKHIPGGYENCASYRIRERDCGPTAQYWQPRAKQGLFKLIVKE